MKYGKYGTPARASVNSAPAASATGIDSGRINWRIIVKFAVAPYRRAADKKNNPPIVAGRRDFYTRKRGDVRAINRWKLTVKELIGKIVRSEFENQTPPWLIMNG
ncbi:hypothetical protein FACS1894139_13690 [Planctomycetales bacterium]|nr:hypothetical protein FACS1894107_06650 [Planctomycetales bacterium]GHS98592.1 hypothetical protein FACS1894108_07010 [Planctomycetales bacterium]GHT06855.1 hypothetical protein FACS1894139_13690 [Planctomycetales bacterium]